MILEVMGQKISCLGFSLHCHLLVGAGNITAHISYDVVNCYVHDHLGAYSPLVHLLLRAALGFHNH